MLICPPRMLTSIQKLGTRINMLICPPPMLTSTQKLGSRVNMLNCPARMLASILKLGTRVIMLNCPTHMLARALFTRQHARTRSVRVAKLAIPALRATTCEFRLRACSWAMGRAPAPRRCGHSQFRRHRHYLRCVFFSSFRLTMLQIMEKRV